MSTNFFVKTLNCLDPRCIVDGLINFDTYNWTESQLTNLKFNYLILFLDLQQDEVNKLLDLEDNLIDNLYTLTDCGLGTVNIQKELKSQIKDKGIENLESILTDFIGYEFDCNSDFLQPHIDPEHGICGGFFDLESIGLEYTNAAVNEQIGYTRTSAGIKNLRVKVKTPSGQSCSIRFNAIFFRADLSQPCSIEPQQVFAEAINFAVREMQNTIDNSGVLNESELRLPFVKDVSTKLHELAVGCAPHLSSPFSQVVFTNNPISYTGEFGTRFVPMTIENFQVCM